MSDWYLLSNPNPAGNFWYPTRKDPVRLIVVHTAESLPDFNPPDMGAENVARYASTTTRHVSWHATVDSDSTIMMLPDSYTAWHVRGYNSQSLGVEMATQASKWLASPDAWRYAILGRTADLVRSWCEKFDIPARRLTRDQADAGEKGIVAHATLDPTRRTDPGPAFPWAWFIASVGTKLAPPIAGTPIISAPTATAAQAVAYHQKKYAAVSRYTPEVVADIAAAYWKHAAHYGVDPAKAFAQALKETGGFSFGGIVPSSAWNFAGIGASGPGQYTTFLTIERGAMAHLLRLRMYAVEDPAAYDLTVLVRALKAEIWGKHPTLESLDGTWAVPGVGYGASIRDDYWKPLVATVVPPIVIPPTLDPTSLSVEEVRRVREMLKWWERR